MDSEEDVEFIVPISDSKLGVDTIPMVLISRKDGLAIEKATQQGSVLLNVDFDVVSLNRLKTAV